MPARCGDGKGGLRIIGGRFFQRFAAPERRLRAERLRLARELHDGLAQELALIALLAGGEGHDGPLEAAAARALAECRATIETLRGEPRRESSASLAQALERLAEREGVAIDGRVGAAVELDAEAQFELLRIVGEAVRNAIRHGGATRVTVELAEDRGSLVLRVSDNGSGFDPDRVPGARYGLVGMRERAADLGGALSVSSGERGTRVELALGS